MAPEQKQNGVLPSDWKVMSLGAVLRRLAIPVAVEKKGRYREIGIRSHGKGVFHKEETSGEAIGGKRVFDVVPGALAMNIVFAWEGAVAKISDREEGMIASHRFPMFVPCGDAEVDIDFVWRFFQTDEGIRLLGQASPGGAGRNRTLNQNFLAATPLPMPPLGEQQKITAILWAVDEVIKATRAVIDQLQLVKKAMMAELLTRGLPGRHTRFHSTKIGSIPQAWSAAPLGQYLDGIDAGWSPKCEPHPASYGEWGVLKVSAVSWGEFRPEENKRLPSTLTPRSEIEVRPQDVIVSRANTPDLVGRAVLVRASPPRLLLSDKLLRLRPRSGIVLPSYLNLVIGSSASRLQIEDSATGSSKSMKNISQDALRAVIVPIPPIEEQQSITAAIDSVSKRAEEEVASFVGLSALKAGLLSALLTGELRVTPDHEAST